MATAGALNDTVASVPPGSSYVTLRSETAAGAAASQKGAAVCMPTTSTVAPYSDTRVA